VLPPDAAAAIGDHLAVCASCLALAADLSALEPPPLAPDEEARIRARVGLAPETRRDQRIAPTIAAAAPPDGEWAQQTQTDGRMPAAAAIAAANAGRRHWIRGPAALATAAAAVAAVTTGAVVAGWWMRITAPPLPVAALPRPPAAERPAARVPPPRVPAIELPLSTLAVRSGRARGTDLARALEPFRAGRYAEAAARLEPLARAGTAPEPAFYLGVARLLAGDARGAIPWLRRSRDRTPPALADRPTWYLALALIGSGDGEAAIRELTRLCGRRSAFGADACTALEALMIGPPS
jgi:hypothetical protein